MQIKNLDKKRVCDLSDDKKAAQIRRGDCITIIRANHDGTLYITNLREKNT